MSNMPTPRNVSTLLRDLLGREVAVNDNRARLTGDVLWALYSNDSGSQEAVWTWDIPGGLLIGAALTMVPADQAQKDIRSKTINEMAMENFQEVANILGSLLNVDQKESLILREVGFDDAKKGKMAEKNKTLSSKSSFNIDIEGYGPGASQLRCTG